MQLCSFISIFVANINEFHYIHGVFFASFHPPENNDECNDYQDEPFHINLCCVRNNKILFLVPVLSVYIFKMQILYENPALRDCRIFWLLLGDYKLKRIYSLHH
jgi:hypothetical protein